MTLQDSCSCSNALQASLNSVAHITTGFNQKISEVDPETLSPFSPHPLFKAAEVEARLWRLTGDEDHERALGELVTILRCYSLRWGNAGKYLRVLEGSSGGW